MAVDTLGHLLAVHVTPTDEQERAQLQRLCKDVTQATDRPVQRAWVDQGYTGVGCIKGGAGQRDRPADHDVAGGEEEGVRVAAPALGGGAQLRLADEIPQGSRGTASDCPKWAGCISLSLRCSRCPLPHGCWLGQEVHNTL